MSKAPFLVGGGRSLFRPLCLVSLLLFPGFSFAQYQPAPLTVAEPVVLQMLQSWVRTLSRNDIPGLAVYYADAREVTPWKERLEARRIQRATLVALHSVRPAPEKSWGGVPLSGEARFTVEFWIEGYPQPLNETRVWGLTNRNGFLQVASEIREKEPDLEPGQSSGSPFPQFGSDQAPAPPPPPAPSVADQPIAMMEMPPQPIPTPPPSPGVATPSVTPSLNEGPIEKDKLISQLWETLLLRFKKSYAMKSEAMYLKLFVRPPVKALAEFRGRLQKSGWMAIENLAIDEESVRGNQLNATFKFRYSPWGYGLKRGEVIEVDAAATRGGPGFSSGWRFTKFGDEELSAMPRAPGYYPTSNMLKSAVTPGQPKMQPQAQKPMFNIFGR